MQPQPARPAQAAAAAAAADAAAVVTTSSASSNTQHENLGKRPAEELQAGRCKRLRLALTAVEAASSSGSSSSSSSSSTDDADDTAVSCAAPLALWEAEQLYAAVVAGEHSLQHMLLQLLHNKGAQAFIACVRYILQQEVLLLPPLQQQQEGPHQQQQQQQQQVASALLAALSADKYGLLTELLHTLSHSNIVTCYNAAIAFQGLADLAGADQVLAAVLAAPHGVLLLLAALNESRLRMAYQQGLVITVCYSGKAVKEPLSSGTVGCMIKCARKQDLGVLVGQLLPVLTWNDESAVAAAMCLVIITRNAAAGVELLLPHTPLLLAAVQQHWRVSKTILLALRIMAETAAAAAANTCIPASTAATAAGAAASSQASTVAAAMAQAGLTPLVQLVSYGTQEASSLAADIITILIRLVPDHPGLVNLVPDLVQGYQQLGPVSLHAVQAVQILRQIAAGSTAGTAAVLPHLGTILALQLVMAVTPEIAEVHSQTQQQQQHQVPIFQLLVTTDHHSQVVNEALRQAAAELVAELAAKPAAAAVLSQQQHVMLLLGVIQQQQQRLCQHDQIMGDQSNVVLRSLFSAVRSLAVTRSGQLALADEPCIDMLLQTMQQVHDQSQSVAFQGFADTALDVLLKLIMAAALPGRSSPALGLAAAAAAGEGGTTAPGAEDASMTHSTQLADLLIKALKPDHIRLLINVGQSPVLAARVLQCLIPMSRLPGAMVLLAPHASDMLQIVRDMLPGGVGSGVGHEADRYLGSLQTAAAVVARGIMGRQLQ